MKANRRREGFLLIEILFAVAFLAVASGIAVQMHQARLDYERRANNRLRDELALENVGERLALIPYDQIEGKADAIAKEFNAQAETVSFDSGDRSGFHVRVFIATEGGVQTRHFWRLEAIK